MRLRSEYFPVSLFRHNLVARSPAQGAEASRLISLFVAGKPSGELPGGFLLDIRSNENGPVQ